jgi:phage gp36-like protein
MYYLVSNRRASSKPRSALFGDQLMAYITNKDIQDRLGPSLYIQLTDDSGSGSADLDVVDATRQEAEGEADSYFARRYAVPIDLSTHPELSSLIKGFVLDLAEYRLHTRRPPVTPDVIAKHAHAVDWFQRIAVGQAELSSLATVTANAATGPVASITGEARLLTRGELDGY